MHVVIIYTLTSFADFPVRWAAFITCSETNNPTPSHTVHHPAMRTPTRLVFNTNAVFIRWHEVSISSKARYVT